jgi:2-keto-3-deoxy-L-rhamnonate aldolase RhmA
MEPRKSTFRRKILDGELQIGMSCHVSVELLEIAGARGLDFAWMDMEHAPRTIHDVFTYARAADALDLPLMVRLAQLDQATATGVLDSGAIGYLVPHVQTADQARQAVAYAKYAPQGDRGMCPQTRTCGFTGWEGWHDFWPKSNEETVVGVIVEDPVGVENLEEICAVPDLDIIWLGAGDYAQSLGLGGYHVDEVVNEARMRTFELCSKYGKVAYCQLPVAGGVEAFASWYDKGLRFFSWPDVSIFAEAYSTLTEGARNSVSVGV